MATKNTNNTKKALPILPDLNDKPTDTSSVFVPSEFFSTISDDVFVKSDSDIIEDVKIDVSTTFSATTSTFTLEEEIETDNETDITEDIVIEIVEDVEDVEEEIEEIDEFEKETIENEEVIEEVGVADEDIKEIKLSEVEKHKFDIDKYFTGTHTLYKIGTSNLKNFLLYTSGRNVYYKDGYFNQPFHILFNKEILVNYYTNIDTVWIEETVLKYKDVSYNLDRISVAFFNL